MNLTRKFTIVTQSANQPGVRRLKYEAEKAGYHVTIATIGSTDEDEVLKNAKHVVFRVGPKSFNHLRDQLARNTNESYAVAELDRVLTAYDKALSAKLLQKSGVVMPATQVVDSIEQLEPSIPYILKDPHSNQGAGVHLISSHTTGVDIAAKILEKGKYCIKQEYIEESKGTDKRLFVVGSRVVAAFKREAQTGEEYRSNLHLGANARPYSPDSSETNLALNAVRAHGLRFAGVDITDSARGPLVLEVNPSPGFEIEKITGINVARLVVEEVMSDDTH